MPASRALAPVNPNTPLALPPVPACDRQQVRAAKVIRDDRWVLRREVFRPPASERKHRLCRAPGDLLCSSRPGRRVCGRTSLLSDLLRPA